MIIQNSKFKFFSGILLRFLYFAAVFIFLFSVKEVLAESSPQISITYPWSEAASQGPASLVNEFYKIALGLAGAAAFGVIIYGAILYTVSAGNTSKQQDAKDWITGAVWGVVLLLGAYLILYTINPNLVELGAIQQAMEGFITPVPTSTFTPPPTPTPGTTIMPESTRAVGDETVARTQLRQQGPGVGIKPACSQTRTTDCVTLQGIRQGTLDEIITLSRDCPGCNIYITGGTEPGHAEGAFSHANGYKIDLGVNPQNPQNLQNLQLLDNYIIGHPEAFLPIGNRSDGAAQYRNRATLNVYAREGDHWDILVTH